MSQTQIIEGSRTKGYTMRRIKGAPVHMGQWEMVFRLALSQGDIIFHIVVEAMSGNPSIHSYQEPVVAKQS